MTADHTRLRLGVVGIVVLSLFAAMFARLWYLQVLDSAELAVKAENNQVRLLYEEAPRGRILDREGRVLVDNRVSQVIAVDRQKIRDHPDVLPRLGAMLDMPVAEIQERIADPNLSPYKPAPVAEDVSEELVVALRERADEFPGVRAVSLTRRSYPNGSVAPHLIGYVGEINDTELAERRTTGYRLGDSIGKTGAERVYEDALRGEPGVEKKQVDSTGRVIDTLDRRDPVRGQDVQLTIDLEIQRAAESALAAGLERARTLRDREQGKPFVAPAGSVVVVDPSNGDIVALASYPAFDPAEFVNGISQARYAELTDPASHYPLNNRAIAGEYAPGSTFKLVTALSALEHGLITPQSTIVDRGTYTIGRCRGRCTFQNAGRRSYGRVDLRKSITVSSDVYYYSLGDRFWQEQARIPDAMQGTARAFGLGTKTGIALSGERPGRIPDPDWKRSVHEANPAAFPDPNWYTGNNLNFAIGQGDVLVTPLQLANLYATFANGGTIHQPRIASRILAPDGTVAHEEDIVEQGRVTIDPAAHTVITQGLAGVVGGDGGTAVGAFRGFPLDEFPIAGKTGTAQVTGKQDSAVFAAYGPVGAPRYAVAVVMEEAGFGGAVAAPVARRIFDRIVGVGDDSAGVEIDPTGGD